ncbi:putative transporter C36.03c [Colletotrichum tanaceti]|uniref:Putative transporter C36.03c n=1 Tax=Colletotrichum tanaceti TaxID=1306861 RepID=A0A4U6XUW0_9PEZI|nr:putative transporter C36.03c [Colletotrichum tanaceti]TKW59805.1 putative transporter C36.03c [Colletotrichum tanaceti]
MQACQQRVPRSGLSSQSDLSWTPDVHVHPRDWGRARKIYDTCIVVFIEFFTTMISTAGSPVANHLHPELGVSPIVATCIFVSTYLIGQTFGGVIFPPWSESFGRKKLYVISTALYCLSCILVARVPNVPGIVTGRFIGGFFSAIPTIVATGSIEDLWDSNARVWWVFWWALVANLGLLSGPVVGELMMDRFGWTWVFYMAAIVTSFVTLLFLTIKESRPSVVMAKAEEELHDTHSWSRGQGLRNKLKIPKHEKLDLVRPLRLFFTEPIVFLVAVISAIAFGLVYLFTEVLPMVYTEIGFEDGWKNIPFLALAVGMLLSTVTRIYDRHYLAKRLATASPVSPESKFTGFFIGAPLLAVGLWWFAWTIPPRVTLVHWVVPTVALVPVGYAVNEFDYVLAGYLTDCYQTYSASAFAALALVRSLSCATFPLFGRALFDSLDFNMASSVFGALATVLCVVPPLLFVFGQRLRESSAFANK